MWKCRKCGGKVLPYGVTPVTLDEYMNIVGYDYRGVFCEDCSDEYENFEDIADWEE
ncbi:MAG: hypothetical protein ACRCZH_02525 [Cetobacterium sp.]